MARRLRARGLGIVLDIVPNHMAVPADMTLNRQLWSVVRDGGSSTYARWFDIDWAAQDDRMLLPVLGGPLESCLGDLLGRAARRAGRRAGAAVLRACPAAAAGDGAAADARAARGAALPARLVAGRGGRAELAAVLRHLHADRDPGRGPGRVRRHPRGHRRPGGRGRGRRAAGGPSRRARGPARLPAPARGGDRGRLGGGGEDPRA